MKKCRERGPGCSGCSRPVCACELAAELVKSKAAGQMTERFAALAIDVCKGYFEQRSFHGFPSDVRDIFQGRFHDRLMKDWRKADPKKNVFSFLTGMARFAGLDVKRQYDSYQARLEKLRYEGTLAECPGESHRVGALGI